MSVENHSRNHAFTLIELLVVISIIALLIGILLPALASARQAAYNAQCLSRLRQYGYGFANYANLYDQRLPPYGGAAVPQALWYDNTDLRHSMGIKVGGDARLGRGEFRDPAEIESEGVIPHTFGVNRYHVFGETGHGNKNRLNSERLEFVESGQFMMGCARSAFILTDLNTTATAPKEPTGDNKNTGAPQYRHLEGSINFLFSDGRAETWKKSAVLDEWITLMGKQTRGL